jgi:hypothetical protein
VNIPSERRNPARPEGRRANQVSFPTVSAARIRVILTPRDGAPLGLTELEVWGPAAVPLARVTAASRDLAFRTGVNAYPKASASFTHAADRVEQVNDLQVAFTRYSRNRWTAYQSPNPHDWVEIDFGTPTTVRTIELYLYGDDRGIRAPREYTLQIWNGSTWQDAQVLSRVPERPLASARNVIAIAPVETSRVRVLLEHDLPAFSGITELIVR